jgi:NADH-quinone oxidoreductase subunit N
MYILFELYATCLILMIGFLRLNSGAAEATLKYLLFNAVATSVMLLSIGALYLNTGTFDLFDITLFTETHILDGEFVLGAALFYFGLYAKLGAAPLHLWVADVFEGAMDNVTLLLSACSKIPYLGILLKMHIYIFFTYIDLLKYLLLFISLLTLVVGALAAMEQAHFKRFFAYSGVNHLGYMLLGYATSVHNSLSGTIIYVIVYSVTTICFFISYIFLKREEKRSSLNINIYMYTTFFELLPVFFGIIVVLSLFSFLGLPPLAGFYAKYALFLAGFRYQYDLFTLLFCLVGVFSAAYYIRFIKVMAFTSKKTQTNMSFFGTRAIHQAYETSFMYYFLAFVMVIFGTFTPIITVILNGLY